MDEKFPMRIHDFEVSFNDPGVPVEGLREAEEKFPIIIEDVENLLEPVVVDFVTNDVVPIASFTEDIL